MIYFGLLKNGSPKHSICCCFGPQTTTAAHLSWAHERDSKWAARLSAVTLVSPKPVEKCGKVCHLISYYSSRWRRRGRLHGRALKTVGWQRPPGKGHRPRWPLTPPMIARHNGLSPANAAGEPLWRRSLGMWTWLRSVTFGGMNKLTHCHNISVRASVESRRSQTVTSPRFLIHVLTAHMCICHSPQLCVSFLGVLE